jgi:hypothetical protein
VPQPPALFPALDLPETGAVVEVLDLACAAGVQCGGEPVGAIGAAETRVRAGFQGFGLNLQDLLFPSTRLGLVGFAPCSRDECGPDTSAGAVFLGDAKVLWSMLAAKKVRRSFALLRMTGGGLSCERADDGVRPYRRFYAMGLVPLRERNLDRVLRGRETPNTRSFTSRSMTCKRIDARG